MLIAVDFDGTVVRVRSMLDPTSPLKLCDGVREALESLKRAGHTLLLYSARANRAMRYPYHANDLSPELEARWWEEAREYEALYQEMRAFVEAELPGVFDAVDDGGQGKPLADLFIDDRAVRYHERGVLHSVDWAAIAERYGE